MYSFLPGEEKETPLEQSRDNAGERRDLWPSTTRHDTISSSSVTDAARRRGVADNRRERPPLPGEEKRRAVTAGVLLMKVDRVPSSSPKERSSSSTKQTLSSNERAYEPAGRCVRCVWKRGEPRPSVEGTKGFRTGSRPPRSRGNAARAIRVTGALFPWSCPGTNGPTSKDFAALAAAHGASVS
jgi:hypothetical protein